MRTLTHHVEYQQPNTIKRRKGVLSLKWVNVPLAQYLLSVRIAPPVFERN